MEQNIFVKFLYSIFLGILLALFLGVGISTFYTTPKAPRWPSELNVGGKEYTQQQIVLQRKFDKKQEAYDKKMKPYNRNVSIAALAGAVIYAGISLLLEKKMKVISDGIMIGGVFSLIYSLGRGFASGDDKYSFIAITIGLIVVLSLGYHRFIHKAEKSESEYKAVN